MVVCEMSDHATDCRCRHYVYFEAVHEEYDIIV